MRYLILLALMLPAAAWPETSLWRVSDGNAELFIGGTVHILGKNDYPLPQEFERAYGQADSVVFETDLRALTEPDAQRQLLQRMLYKDGRTLKDDLNDESYTALAAYCKDIGIAIENLQTFKPPMVVVTLMMAELQRWGLAETGVDEYFNRKAESDGKNTKGLESLEKQFDLMEKMGLGHENELILSALEEIRELPVAMKDMKNAWRTGDVNGLERLGVTPMQSEYPALYKDILVDRNRAWLPTIIGMLQTPEREFILVGALHLVGSDGVLEQLRGLGYKVEPF